MLTAAVRGRDDRGQLTLLVIGFVALAATLVVVGVDVSKVFLARRALASAADAAALSAAEAVDRDAIYTGGGVGCGQLLPVDPARAATLVDAVLTDDVDDLRAAVRRLDRPVTTVDGGVVTVALSGRVAVPFGHVLALLVPGHADGTVAVGVTAHARSPLTLPGGC